MWPRFSQPTALASADVVLWRSLLLRSSRLKLEESEASRSTHDSSATYRYDDLLRSIAKQPAAGRAALADLRNAVERPEAARAVTRQS
jgi:hypothetical protein